MRTGSCFVASRLFHRRVVRWRSYRTLCHHSSFTDIDSRYVAVHGTVWYGMQVSTDSKARLATDDEINDARWSRLRKLGKKVRRAPHPTPPDEEDEA